MQQFRPLPRFDTIEEAEPVETRPQPLIRPPLVAPSVEPQTGSTAGSKLNPDTTGRMPVLLFTGPHATPATDQLAALTKKSVTAGHPSLTSALQATMGVTTQTNRIVIIPAGTKRKKVAANAPVRHMKPRVRHMLILAATLGILLTTLATLLPLSSGQGGATLLNDFTNLMRSAQMDAHIEAQINDTHAQFNPNPANLPPMHIANSPYVAVAQQAALTAGISPIYFVRQINQESAFNPNALSITGAEGIAQFEPGTAAGLGINPLDPAQALNGAAQLMSRYYFRYGDYAKALGAYNAGTGTLQSATNACGVNWLSCMPAQTQNYVYVIMGI